MDYGAMLGSAAQAKKMATKLASRKRMPVENPNRRSAHYTKQSKFAGSDREIRGKILRELMARTTSKAAKKMSESSIIERLAESPARVTKILQALAREGFIVKNGRYIRIIN